jgi:hypothetical protein
VARGVQDAEGKYEVLAKYARDLTEEARAGKLVRALCALRFGRMHAATRVLRAGAVC